MKVQIKPEVAKKMKLWGTYLVVLLMGISVPTITTTLQTLGKPEDPQEIARKAAIAQHTVHTAKLGVPTLENFSYRDPMQEFFPNNNGTYLAYPLTLTCGCSIHREQIGVANIEYVDWEGKEYVIKHTPKSEDHKNLWFLVHEVGVAPAAAKGMENIGISGLHAGRFFIPRLAVVRSLPILHLFFTLACNMLLITCPFGLSSLLGSECKRLGYQPIRTFPTGCWIERDDAETIMTLNLRLRTANKVFFCLNQGTATTFEELFQLVKKSTCSPRLYGDTLLSLDVICQNSPLHAIQTVQSVAHKAFLELQTQLPNRPRDEAAGDVIHILVLLQDDQASLLINTSGPSLHERGYRKHQSDASLKEHLASAVVLLSNRRFHLPLRDPCCGGGTLLIEAARIVRNLAPGAMRSFAFETFPAYDASLRTSLHAAAAEKRIDKSRILIGSDIDPRMVHHAKENARFAQVDDCISFVEHDVCKRQVPAGIRLDTATTVIANPPYDIRLQEAPTRAIHQRLADLISGDGRKGAVISAYEQAKSIFLPSQWKRNEIRQGALPAYIFSKKA